jgi:hypothetical protein
MSQSQQVSGAAVVAREVREIQQQLYSQKQRSCRVESLVWDGVALSSVQTLSKTQTTMNTTLGRDETQGYILINYFSHAC